MRGRCRGSSAWARASALVRALAAGTPVVTLAATSGCAGEQSALDPAGRDASRIAELFWGMTIGTAVIWLAVVALTVYAIYFARRVLSPKAGRLLVIIAGVVIPSVVLCGLLVHSLAMLPDLLRAAPEGALKIEVVGHQWWWRVRYLRDGAEPVDLANEIHLPVGRAVEFELESRDVVHSFWIPALGGKVDMIPGRRTRLVLEPTKIGVYRGICAEYCGSSHALMSFYAVVEAEHDFERWLAAQAAPAPEPASEVARRGAELFLANGCGGCHAVRGTAADGVIGPDLTHVGSRRSLAAGTLPAKAHAFRSFVARPGDVKPSALMPAFDMLSAEELDALAVYLEGLK